MIIKPFMTALGMQGLSVIFVLLKPYKIDVLRFQLIRKHYRVMDDKSFNPSHAEAT